VKFMIQAGVSEGREIPVRDGLTGVIEAVSLPENVAPMQFIPHGPEIPNGLLQANEESRVVFFCGAGIGPHQGPQGHSTVLALFGHSVSPLTPPNVHPVAASVVSVRFAVADQQPTATGCHASMADPLTKTFFFATPEHHPSIDG
jgi:hypothetical protein